MLRNTAASGAHWLGIDVRQSGPNRAAIGATVAIESGPAAGARLRVRTDGSYLSASDPRRLIGLGAFDRPIDLAITWPDGTTERLRALQPGRYHLVEKAAAPAVQ